MNGTEHTFPIAEEAAHKLDDLKADIEHSQPVQEARDMLGMSPDAKTMNMIAVGIGVLALILWLRD
jgi:hypothetical protein